MAGKTETPELVKGGVSAVVSVTVILPEGHEVKLHFEGEIPTVLDLKKKLIRDELIPDVPLSQVSLDEEVDVVPTGPIAWKAFWPRDIHSGHRYYVSYIPGTFSSSQVAHGRREQSGGKPFHVLDLGIKDESVTCIDVLCTNIIRYIYEPINEGEKMMVHDVPLPGTPGHRVMMTQTVLKELRYSLNPALLDRVVSELPVLYLSEVMPKLRREMLFCEWYEVVMSGTFDQSRGITMPQTVEQFEEFQDTLQWSYKRDFFILAETVGLALASTQRGERHESPGIPVRLWTADKYFYKLVTTYPEDARRVLCHFAPPAVVAMVDITLCQL
eukprot:m51a1_g6543 hypothetical protein (328) ;mRNA; r:64986-66116